MATKNRDQKYIPPSKRNKRGGYKELKKFLTKHTKAEAKGVENKFVDDVFSVDPYDALGDLGYGSREAAVAESEKADRYNEGAGYKYRVSGHEKFPVNASSHDRKNSYLPRYGSVSISSGGGSRASKVNGYRVNRENSVDDVLGTFGHELTHKLTDNADDPEPEDIRATGGISASSGYDIGEGDMIYPEYARSEEEPPLAAYQRHMFKTTGKRIESPEVYDKEMKKYDAMSQIEKKKFHEGLPKEVRRLFNYRDGLSKTKSDMSYVDFPRGRDAYYNGDEADDDKTLIKTDVKGKDRLNRYDKRNRKKIPGLVNNSGGGDPFVA